MINTMKKNKHVVTSLLLVLALMSIKVNAQDTLSVPISIERNVTLTMLGVEIGLPVTSRGFINPNVTIPQRITSEYYIIHYIAGGYSFLRDEQDEYVFSYGIGIPLYDFQKGILYGYLVDAYHYRPKLIVVDPNKNRDFRQRRVRFAYRKNLYEFSTTYTIRHSLIFGVSYSFNN